MRNVLKPLLLAFTCGTGLMAWAGTEGVVTANLLNVRMKPELKSVVIAKLSNGTKVEILATTDDFYEITAPTSSAVYVSAVYLRNGKVLSPVRMRSDMSAIAPIYGTLSAGAEVKVVREHSYGWVQIEPPSELKAYVAKNYVKVLGEVPVKSSEVVSAPKDVTVASEASPAPAPTEKATVDDLASSKKSEGTDIPVDSAPVAVPATEVTTEAVSTSGNSNQAETTTVTEDSKPVQPDVKTESAGSEPVDEQLKQLGVDLHTSAETVIEGILVAIPKTTVEFVKYAVMETDANGQYTKSYFICGGDAEVLAKALEKKVKITGSSYKVPTWNTPLVKVLSCEQMQ